MTVEHTFNIKSDVKISDMHPLCVKAIPIICDVFWAFGYDATITSGREGNHRNDSFHTTKLLQAYDWRTWENSRGEQMAYDLKMAIAREIMHELRKHISPKFQFEIENTHIHIEFDDR